MIDLIPGQPALIVKDKNYTTLVITDLHIGWELSLSQKGIHVPTQTPKILEKLLNIILKYKPDRLLVLGDVKHTVAKAEIGEWRDVPDFFTEVRKHVEEIGIIRGNHDGNLEPLLPERVKLLPATGFVVDDVGFFHGHRWPSPTLLKCKTLVMGHVHPVVAFRDPAGFRITRQVWIKANCKKNNLAKLLLEKHGVKKTDDSKDMLRKHYGIKVRTVQLFIMPSFNDFLGGRPLNMARFGDNTRAGMTVGPVLRSEAVDLENAETYLLDGTFLGTLNQLKLLS
jgi:putative SbcD/Mre11-related phosphoesterase